MIKETMFGAAGCWRRTHPFGCRGRQRRAWYRRHAARGTSSQHAELDFLSWWDQHFRANGGKASSELY